MSAAASLSPPIASNSKNQATSKSIWLSLGVHLIGLFPLARLSFFWLVDRLTANPIQFVEQRLGRASLDMLVLTLAVAPLVALTGWKTLSKSRRALGLYAFFYFALHFLAFTVLDYGFDLREIFRLIVEKPYLVVGLLAGLILFALAITSSRYWMERLGKSWKRLHKTIYLAAGLVILHYAWAVKGSLSTLNGDLLRPLGMGLLVTILLILRIPPVRRWAAYLRFRYLSRG